MVRANVGFYLHTRRFRVILPIYIVVALIFPILYGANVLQRPADVYSYTSLALGELLSFTALLAALLAGDAISQDFGRQGFFTLTQPVRRSEIMLARTLAAFVFSALAMLAWIGIGLVSGLAFYSSIVANWAPILGFSILLAGSIVSFVVLFSSLFKSPTMSVVVSVLIVWLVMPIITGVLDLVGVEPWFLLTYAGGVVDGLAEKIYPPHVTSITAIAGGAGSAATVMTPSITVTTFTPYVWEAAVIMAAYLVVSLALGWFVYSRKELRDVS
jgi:ABC-type transport system involved in multi-copper enzyme maturation permease subunit